MASGSNACGSCSSAVGKQADLLRTASPLAVCVFLCHPAETKPALVIHNLWFLFCVEFAALSLSAAALASLCFLCFSALSASVSLMSPHSPMRSPNHLYQALASAYAVLRFLFGLWCKSIAALPSQMRLRSRWLARPLRKRVLLALAFWWRVLCTIGF